MIRQLFPLLAAGMLVYACKKDDSESSPYCSAPEAPGNYFPAFAGSYWNYTDQNGLPVTYSIADHYTTCHGQCRPTFENLHLCVSENTLISDVYAGMGATYEYKSWIWSAIPDSARYCFVSFSTQHTTFTPSNGGFPRYMRTAITVDTTLTIPGFPTFPQVIVMEEFDVVLPVHRYLDYFAENVGLVRRDSINVSDTVTLLTLDNYHIGQ
jgi:hypothetical protein